MTAILRAVSSLPMRLNRTGRRDDAHEEEGHEEGEHDEGGLAYAGEKLAADDEEYLIHGRGLRGWRGRADGAHEDVAHGGQVLGEGDGFDLCGEVAEEFGVGGIGRFAQQIGAVAFGIGSAGFGDLKKAVDGLEHFAGGGEGVGVVAETAAHVAHFAAEYHAGVADEGDVVAEFFDALHVVGGEDDGVTGVAEFEDFALEEVGVEGVEAREGFVENEQGRAVHHGGDELHFFAACLWRVLRGACSTNR